MWLDQKINSEINYIAANKGIPRSHTERTGGAPEADAIIVIALCFEFYRGKALVVESFITLSS